MQVECGTDYEACLKIFKKVVDKSGILREVRSRRFYLTKTQKRKLKDSIANKRRCQRERRLHEKAEA